MNIAVPRPLSESLALEVEQDTKRTPQEDQAHIQHDWLHVAVSDDPWRNEFAKPIAPDVLVHCDRDEDTAGNRLVAVDSVG